MQGRARRRGTLRRAAPDRCHRCPHASHARAPRGSPRTSQDRRSPAPYVHHRTSASTHRRENRSAETPREPARASVGLSAPDTPRRLSGMRPEGLPGRRTLRRTRVRRQEGAGARERPGNGCIRARSLEGPVTACAGRSGRGTLCVSQLAAQDLPERADWARIDGAAKGPAHPEQAARARLHFRTRP